MDSAVGQAALLLWPLVGLALFLSLDALSATFWTIVGGFLLLPVNVSIDFPLVPAIDKESLPSLVALLGLLFLKQRQIPLLPRPGAGRWLVIALVLLSVGTVLTNPEPIITAERALPSLTLHDAAAVSLGKYLAVLPFIIGVALVRSPEDLLRIARLMVIAGLAYSILALFEIRMSPQLHTWVYGIAPHDFLQQIRFGGYRPMVFIGHGLTVSMFMAIVLGCAVLLWRQRVRILGLPPQAVVIYLAVVLILCKSVGAIVLGVLVASGIAFLGNRNKGIAAKICGMIALAYPFLSLTGLFPKDGLVDAFDAVLPERAASLDFRFQHEEALLARAMEKPWFGWGGYGRAQLDGSVTDGFWIISLGELGVLGFYVLFLLLLLPIRKVRTSALKAGSEHAELGAAWLLMIAALMLDQLPNASLAAPYWFLIGAVTAGLRTLRSSARPAYIPAQTIRATGPPGRNDQSTCSCVSSKTGKFDHTSVKHQC